MPAFRDILPGESLDHFHQRCVIPTPDEKYSRNVEIDAFVQFLQWKFNTTPYTVAKVLKSGSLGKGTAVRGSADIDLVVVINGVSSIWDLIDQRSALLKRMNKVSRRYPWEGRLCLVDRTDYSLTYTLNDQKVDILLALNIDSIFEDRQDVYYELTEDNYQEFSVSLAPLQIDFVKPEREAVKRVIRLLKFWKQERNVDIRPYTLELLTINAFNQNPWGTTDTVFRRVLGQLANCGSIRVAFDYYYNSREYTQYLDAPYVLDPANPYMDTLYGKDVRHISRKANGMLRHM